MTDLTPDRLDTVAAARFLTARGYPIKASSLMTFRARGGGPPFYRWGPRVFYLEVDLIAWAEARTRRIEAKPTRPERRDRSKGAAGRMTA